MRLLTRILYSLRMYCNRRISMAQPLLSLTRFAQPVSEPERVHRVEVRMKTLFAATALVLCVLALNGWTQVINASLSGTVSDVTGALIPGAEITAKQTGTGVVST